MEDLKGLLEGLVFAGREQHHKAPTVIRTCSWRCSTLSKSPVGFDRASLNGTIFAIAVLYIILYSLGRN